MKMKPQIVVVEDHRGHSADAEARCTLFGESCRLSHRAQLTRGQLGTAGQGYPLPGKVKFLELGVLRGPRTISGRYSSHRHSDKECGISWTSTTGGEDENNS